jgi:hypothetical protein
MTVIDDIRKPGRKASRRKDSHRLAKAPKDRAAAASDPRMADPWRDWAPAWSERAAEKTPHDHQEKHSPTENFSLPPEESAQKQEIHSNQRRIVDARLWGAMTAIQQIAAMDIAVTVESLSAGLGFAKVDLNHVRGSAGGNASEAHGHKIRAYFEWAQKCHHLKISHAMILDILVFGHSCRQADRDRRVRAGSARQNLMDGLDLYCKLQGWR